MPWAPTDRAAGGLNVIARYRACAPQMNVVPLNGGFLVAYRTDGQRFALCWQVAFDRCRHAEGGVSAPLRRMANRPWPESGGDRPR